MEGFPILFCSLELEWDTLFQSSPLRDRYKNWISRGSILKRNLLLLFYAPLSPDQWVFRYQGSVVQLYKPTIWSCVNTFSTFYQVDIYSSADVAFGHKILPLAPRGWVPWPLKNCVLKRWYELINVTNITRRLNNIATIIVYVNWH